MRDSHNCPAAFILQLGMSKKGVKTFLFPFKLLSPNYKLQ